MLYVLRLLEFATTMERCVNSDNTLLNYFNSRNWTAFHCPGQPILSVADIEAAFAGDFAAESENIDTPTHSNGYNNFMPSANFTPIPSFNIFSDENDKCDISNRNPFQFAEAIATAPSFSASPSDSVVDLTGDDSDDATI